MLTIRGASRIRRLGVLVLSLSACERTSVECLLPPCVLPIAVEITVSNRATHSTVPGAFIVVGSGASTQQAPCVQGEETVCRAMGGSGTYELDISAPGYQTVHRRVEVTGTTPTCGCESVDLQKLQIALEPLA